MLVSKSLLGKCPYFTAQKVFSMLISQHLILQLKFKYSRNKGKNTKMTNKVVIIKEATS
ncbi:hypothetical protein LL037_21745 [Clostridium estertheticum]|uniref:hypothetical protein n=1 Tax=Clostridium estertheticum TaxID=238834 RepID=UPI001C0B043B|nr:hypothetical protein [Clostridium estertheticum]MBU3198368.1 hypothetical protein [Clostridium estertheticum]WAG65051.1 hypothetical protein LL037_21745 [Clostridium estertheticum]